MLISVKVVPNSREASVEKIEEGRFKVKVDEKAEEGRANKRLIEILAKYFQVQKSTVVILKGQRSKNKIVEIIL